jgi:hypothetical protein
MAEAERRERAGMTGAGRETAEAFLARVDAARRSEAGALDALFRAVTGFRPVVWGGSMLGYGRYRYREGGQTAGEWFATGFAPRRADLVLYLQPGEAGFGTGLDGLGPHRTGKGCLYLKRLDGIDRAVLERVIRACLDDLSRRWTVWPE